MALFPKFYKVLELQQQYKNRHLDYAIVEDGFLVVAAEPMLIRVDLRIYFGEGDTKHLKGKAFSAELLEMMAHDEVNGIYFSKDQLTLSYRDGQEEDLYYAGRLTLSGHVKYDIRTGEELKPQYFIKYPDYEKHLNKKWVPKAYPMIGLNIQHASILSDCFSQSLQEGREGHHLKFELPETDSNFQPAGDASLKVTPFYKEHSYTEEALLMPSTIPGMGNMEDLV